MEKYPDYELVIDEVHQYYNLPLISFDYQEGNFRNTDTFIHSTKGLQETIITV